MSKKKRIEVFSSSGTQLGYVNGDFLSNTSGYVRLGYYTYDPSKRAVSLHIQVPKGSFARGKFVGDILWRVFTQRLHDDERETSRNSQASDRLQGETSARARDERRDTKADRLKRRRRMVEAYLADRSEECRSHVLRVLNTASEYEIERIVSAEVRAHPMPADILPHERVKYRSLALANAYDRERSGATEDTDALLAEAHLFVFDDDAWWEAMGCPAKVAKLPYPVCLVDDVLAWDLGGKIKFRALSDGAYVKDAKRALNFVTECCSATGSGAAKSYHRTPAKAPLPGSIEVSSVSATSGGGRRSTVPKGSSTSGTGRSPRPFPRRGHWRNQACGPGMKQHKRIWISDTIVSASGKSFRVSSPSRVHRVTLS